MTKNAFPMNIVSFLISYSICISDIKNPVYSRLSVAQINVSDICAAVLDNVICYRHWVILLRLHVLLYYCVVSVNYWLTVYRFVIKCLWNYFQFTIGTEILNKWSLGWLIIIKRSWIQFPATTIKTRRVFPTLRWNCLLYTSRCV